MSYSNGYLPIPPRAWSRVDNKCTYDNSTSINIDNSDSIYDPAIFYRAALINKGNVLQYKKNSTQLTKKQRYAQIAKGLWTNRTKTWATQSATYTNPNTTSLKRVGFVEYPKDDITPGSPANIAGPYIPVSVLKDPFNCPDLTFKDGGSLVCGVYQDPCTGEVVDKTYEPKYYPTSDSDVPGPIEPLYWDPKLQTWYPKVRRVMNNSTNKWPTNYKLFRSAIYPGAPVLEIVSSTTTSVELVWTINDKNNRCYPVSNFQIYVNNGLYKTIVGSTNYTTTLTNLTKGPYKIYIVGILSGNKSLPSNIVVYNNEIVTKKSVNADNKTYSVDVTDLGNTITDIANGNIDTVNETSNGGSIFNSEIDYYIIENTNNNTNAVFLPDYLITENNKTITIVNKTLDSLTILSTAPIYNIQYTPTEGTHALEIGENAIVILRYIYTKDHTLSIYADML
jgi:hypothetical protein